MQAVRGIAPGIVVKVSNTDEFIYLDISHALLTSCLTAYREWLVRVWVGGNMLHIHGHMCAVH